MTTARVSVKTSAMEFTVALTVLDCASCAVVYAIPDSMQRERVADGKDFYCPNGHAQVYRESDRLPSSPASLSRTVEVSER
jgi:hypothetical protein